MSTGDQPFLMWSYWRDKYGEAVALTEYFPETLAKNPDLQLALYQIKAAHALIHQTMEKLNDESEE